MDGGHASPAFQLEIDDICQSRQDCVGIFSVPYANEAASSYMSQILQYRNTDLALDSSYSALYTPHLKIFDRFNDRNLFVSPDGFAAAAISATASNYEIWFPAAGFTRGKITTALETRRKFDEGERDALYDAQINPIRFTAGRGIAIWGQKTMQVRPSSLQNLNVRLLLLVIEPAVSEALEEFLFEINDSTTRLIAKTRIDRYMENIQSRRGVFEFSTICDETNNSSDDIDNNRMNVDLYVKPVGAVEIITYRTIITSFGVSLAQST
jgi:phage tail sheath protein FI